jgi:hypothetical protein
LAFAPKKLLLDFNINKAVAAASYLIEREGGSVSMFVLVKELYYADRTALIKWGNSITGDELASLRKGPIVSGIYNLMKGGGLQENLVKWDDVIQRSGNTISLRKEADKSLLSEREIEVLEDSRRTINSISGSIADWLHEHCPEWTDPGNSSIPIDPSTILRVASKTEDEIRQIEKDNDEVRHLNYLLGAR